MTVVTLQQILILLIVMRSHLISQIILREFVNSNNQVRVHNKKTGKIHLESPYDIGYEEIDKRIIGELEKHWNSDIETKATKSLNILRNGDLLHQPKHQKTIKDLMSLHFVRSATLLSSMNYLKSKYAGQIIKSVVADYPEHESTIKSYVLEHWERDVDETLPEILKENITKVQDFMNRHGLEIGYAPGSKLFVIGDSPAITISKDGNGDVITGAPITEAESFAIPLTPRHLVTLKTKPASKKYIDLTDRQVENVNSKQISFSIKEYYSVPE